MPIRKVYFVRHGETDHNASGLLQGSRNGTNANQGIHGPAGGLSAERLASVVDRVNPFERCDTQLNENGRQQAENLRQVSF